MSSLGNFINIFLHLDKFLLATTSTYGIQIYFILFLVIFFETGIVIFPLLPGDSLLFAAGALAATSTLDIKILFVLLGLAAIVGDSLNYFIGKKFGEKFFTDINSKFFKKEHLNKTEEFYRLYGTRAVMAGRFFPIIRTFVPFIAGMGSMDYSKFISYNALGGVLWVGLFLYAGFLFGNIPVVKENFTLTVFVIVVASLIPSLKKFFGK